MAHKMRREQRTLPLEMPKIRTNALYYGDNFVWLKNHEYFPNDSIDLIYLDPPFNSNTDYNILFNEKTGEQSQAQWKAFDDTWKWEMEASHTAILELVVKSPTVAEFIRWLSRQGDSKSVSMAAYLSMMAVRLIELHRVLKPTGSVYLHCDPTASHYIKVIMDSIFGHNNFRNEIIWQRAATKGDARVKFGAVHDVILYYSKSISGYHFSPIYIEKDEEYLSRFRFNDNDGRGAYRLAPLDSPNPRPNLTYEYKGYKPPLKGWRISRKVMEQLDNEGRLYFPKDLKGRIARKHYLSEQKGRKSTDVWADIIPLQASNKERLGYPTQKPEALLERIIEASSNKGAVILDPFCGCGTAIVSSHKLGRKWIGIDVTYLAINLVERRLDDRFGNKVRSTYRVYGDPFDFASAKALFERDKKDKHAFELWALKLVNARPRAKDGGVDGVIGFLDHSNNLHRVVVQIKGGSNLSPTIIRDLIGTVQKENAAMGLLISLHSPTRGMYQDANHAGDYRGKDRLYKKIQIRTITELLEEDKPFDLPYENSVAIPKEHGKQELLF